MHAKTIYLIVILQGRKKGSVQPVKGVYKLRAVDRVRDAVHTAWEDAVLEKFENDIHY